MKLHVYWQSSADYKIKLVNEYRKSLEVYRMYTIASILFGPL